MKATLWNQHFEDPEFELSLMSLNGSLPIVLCDPRKLSKYERTWMKRWDDWMRNVQEKERTFTERVQRNS